MTTSLKDADNNETSDQETVTETIYGDVVVTPLNGENYLSFQMGNLRFLHLFQFSSTSLESLFDVLKRQGVDDG